MKTLSASATTVALFGATSLLAGARNLFNRPAAMKSLALPTEYQKAVAPASDGLALAAVAMGLYYPLAAVQENYAFFQLSVGMRLLTAAVFWPHGRSWRTAALWEAGGAVLTAIALGWDLMQGYWPS